MNDYERIARIIRYLDEHYADQPDLALLARVAGLSPSHFHRLFAEWAGVTPKDFLQCLTLRHAKELLRHGESVLHTALETGLSGPGRLHDLCVTLEAASPGELKSGGTTWTIQAGFAASPFGICLIAEGPRGICHLAFVDEGKEKAAWDELKSDWTQATLVRVDATAAKLVRQLFKAPPHPAEAHPLRAFVHGTSFQVRVWRALMEVPPGEIVSYSRLASAIGASKAVRAVGSAVARNNLAYLIPCHRVIRETGVIGEYRWGSLRKRVLVAWERARSGKPCPEAAV
jgi:AraC family transcriptional regulator of adaptative response/methylated-DNA-[protein]-cysteine methyltransferase